MSFIPEIRAEFSASLLQSSVSHDPSGIIYNNPILMLKKHFWILLCCAIFLWKLWYIFSG